jgi:multiple sugar transport system permease protein
MQARAGLAPPSTLRATRPRLYSWATVAPVLAIIALFTIFPFGFAAVTSLRRVLLTAPGATPFVGLDNYAEVLSNSTFRTAAGKSLVFSAITVPLVSGVGMAVALLLNQRLRGFGMLRALVLLPWSIPLVSAGIIWRLLLHGNFGALNGLLFQLGLIETYVPWLSHSTLALLSVIVAHVWREFPLPAILFLAGLQTIPRDVVDAAKVDGAGAWERFRFITLPLLKAPLLIVLVYETMIAIAVFDLIYVLTGGGPGSATTVISWYAYAESFKFLDLGHGAALSFLLSAVLLALIAVYLRIVRLEGDQG